MGQILVQNVPPIDLPIQQTTDRIIEALQKKFAEQGYLRGLVAATLDQCVEQELAVNEKILFTYIRDNWGSFFPGVDEDDFKNVAQAQETTHQMLQTMKGVIREKLAKYLLNADASHKSSDANFRSLLIEEPDLDAILRKPCDGGPHEFQNTYPPQYVLHAFVRTRWFHRERTLWKKHYCGNHYLYRASVTLWPCKNCNVAHIAFCKINLYCDYCGRVIERDPMIEGVPLGRRTIIQSVINGEPQYKILSRYEVLKLY